uniref:Uncharacterized protein n=1 Tax=Arundo donax TaxID=35708 RepID=A0A0A8ZV70_ARUDO
MTRELALDQGSNRPKSSRCHLPPAHHGRSSLASSSSSPTSARAARLG